MTDFNHGMWGSLMASLELQPLERGSRLVVDDLLSGDEFAEDADEIGIIDRLAQLGLVDEDYKVCDCCGHESDSAVYVASQFLRQIEARDMLDKIFERNAP